MAQYLQEKRQWQLNVMSITKCKKYINKNKIHFQMLLFQTQKGEESLHTLLGSSDDKTYPTPRRGEMHSLMVSACTRLFSAETPIQQPLNSRIVHKQNSSSATTAFMWLL